METLEQSDQQLVAPQQVAPANYSPSPPPPVDQREQTQSSTAGGNGNVLVETLAQPDPAAAPAEGPQPPDSGCPPPPPQPQPGIWYQQPSGPVCVAGPAMWPPEAYAPVMNAVVDQTAFSAPTAMATVMAGADEEEVVDDNLIKCSLGTLVALHCTISTCSCLFL